MHYLSYYLSWYFSWSSSQLTAYEVCLLGNKLSGIGLEFYKHHKIVQSTNYKQVKILLEYFETT